MKDQLTRKHHTHGASNAQTVRHTPVPHQRPRGDSAWVRAVPRQQAARPSRHVLTPTAHMRQVSRQPMPPPAHAANRRTGAPQKKAQNIAGRHTALIVIVLAVVTLGVFSTLAAGLGVALIYAQGALPGVSVAGIDVGGQSQDEIAQRLAAAWETVVLRDGERTFRMGPEALGITLNADATAEQAYAKGRTDGSPVQALLGDVSVAPVFIIDDAQARAGLQRIAQDVNVAPVNAGVTYRDGTVSATQPQNGRALDVDATLSRLNANAAVLSNGVLELVMQDTSPAITDASPLVDAAADLLRSPLTVRAYDPVTGNTVDWTAQPQTWNGWITAESAPDSPTGLALSLQAEPVRAYLESRASVFDSTRYIDVASATTALQNAVRQRETTLVVRVQHAERTHTVRPGESITSIAWDYGVPYPWIQELNPGVESLTVGQQITLPAADRFLYHEPIPGKRIEVSLSEQRTRVYEDDQLIWDWSTSTGINDSPTWPGVYQVITHERNAYAGRWDLWMPWFIGVYQPIPGADFTNGFHGFPTRGGGQILWENSLGRRVTYGCILLSDTNAQRLYEWAENGVVVEITP